MLARNAVKRGLQVKPWVKTSLAPGSQVVTDYLEKAGLQDDLDTLGFNLVGYGCTTCIGNSGPLPEEISKTIQEPWACRRLGAVRKSQFRGPGQSRRPRQLPRLAAARRGLRARRLGAWSISPPNRSAPMPDGEPVYLKDIWPSSKAVAKTVRKAVKKSMFRRRYGNVFEGDSEWQDIEVTGGLTYEWDGSSTYVQNPPYFDDLSRRRRSRSPTSSTPASSACSSNSITTDHISPAGSIKRDSPAGRYLTEHDVARTTSIPTDRGAATTRS